MDLQAFIVLSNKRRKDTMKIVLYYLYDTL